MKTKTSDISIPDWERTKGIAFWGGLATVAFTVIYGICNKHAASSTSHFALYTDWELSIPLIPWMIFPYVSLNLLFLFSFLTVKTPLGIKGFCLSMVWGAVVAGLFFYFFPGKLGFERIAAPEFKEIFDFMFSIDHPHNLFPSLHVTYSGLGVFVIRQQTQSQKLHAILYVWLIFICSSVVLVHQHHLFDVVTGALLALGLYRLVYLRYVSTERNDLI